MLTFMYYKSVLQRPSTLTITHGCRGTLGRWQTRMPEQLGIEPGRLARIIEGKIRRMKDPTYGRASARSSEIKLIILTELITEKSLF